MDKMAIHMDKMILPSRRLDFAQEQSDRPAAA